MAIAAKLSVRIPLLRFLVPVTLAGQLQDDAMVDHPVDGRRRSHGIFKDFVPLREHEVAADQHAAALVALSQERVPPNKSTKSFTENFVIV